MRNFLLYLQGNYRCWLRSFGHFMLIVTVGVAFALWFIGFGFELSRQLWPTHLYCDQMANEIHLHNELKFRILEEIKHPTTPEKNEENYKSWQKEHGIKGTAIIPIPHNLYRAIITPLNKSN